jgi:hypothetical protein
MAGKDIKVVVIGELRMTFYFSFLLLNHDRTSWQRENKSGSSACELIHNASNGMGSSLCVSFVIKHNNIYRRPADHRSFRFILSESDSSSSLWEKFQFVLITVDLGQEGWSLYSNATASARRISKSAPHPGLICILVTKVDFFSQDPSKFEYWSIPTRCTFVEGLQCYGVSVFDGTGILDVYRFIGNVSVNLSLSPNTFLCYL